MNINDRVQPLRKQHKKPSGTVRAPGNKVLTWLSKRKITPETAVRFSIGQTDDDTIVFPYYFDGQLVNRKFRKLFNLKESEDAYSQEKGAKPCLFGCDLISPDADTLLIVEGECDALAAWQYGLEAVSIPGGASNSKWIEEEWEYLKRFRRILLALDNDTAGEDGVEAIIKRLGYKWDVYRVRLPFKDVNDCLINGVLEDEVRWCLEKAESLRPPEVKRLSEVVEHLRDEPEAGLPCELPGLTEKLGGWRPGELTIHGGEAACGKTTATCQEVVGLLEQGQRVCMASFSRCRCGSWCTSWRSRQGSCRHSSPTSSASS